MIQNESYIIHYGIHGQKWGVRRFQNKDGSLTAEGKERYLIGTKMDNFKTRLKKAGESAARVVKNVASKKKESFIRKHKPVSMMSDQELREKLSRMNQERQYKQILDEMSGRNRPKKTFSQKHPIIQQVFVNTALTTAASIVSKQLGVKADEVLVDRRMQRAKEKNMLSEDKIPFVYNTLSRITSYNKQAKANSEPTVEVRSPKRYKFSSVSTATKNKEGIKLAWDGLRKNLNTVSASDIHPLSESNSPGVDLILKALKKNS